MGQWVRVYKIILFDITLNLNYFYIKFDLNLWNTFGSESPRTNNFVESFNKLINEKLSLAHPNIWKFIDLIKELDNKMAIDLGRESSELVFYEAPISEKDKLKHGQLKASVYHLVKGEVS